MKEAVIERASQAARPDRPGAGHRVSILGVPLGYGCDTAGVDLGPAALRVAKLNPRIAKLGYEVRDLGNLRIPVADANLNPCPEMKHLAEIAAVCEDLA